jgi:uncharacterized membrane protein
MTNTLKKIFIITVSMLICDGLWLGVVANSFYFENLRHLVSANGDTFNVNYSAAAAVYFFLVLNFTLFISDLVLRSNWSKALCLSFVAGVSVYGVYDFTNMATLRDWPLSVSLIDTLWGGTLYLIAALSLKSAQKFGIVK